MLGRAAPTITQVTTVVNLQQNRNMATLKSIAIRLKSIKNISKITKSMKMVSASKYARAERDLKAARPYGEGSVQFYERAEVTHQDDDPKELLVAMTSDKGLCGAIHSSVTKLIRTRLQEPGAENIKVICVGEKSRAILQRLYSKHIISVAKDVGKRPPTFLDATKLANAILTCGYEYASGKIIYNKFKSVVAYSQENLPLFSQKAVENAPKLSTYDSLDADVIQSYMEFSLASMLFYALKEGACSEQSARMTAMDNATKNAGEMIEKLSMTYNRTRQSVITNDLIEIISGAAALEDAN